MAGPIDNTPPSVPWKIYAGDRNYNKVAFFASEGIPWDLTGATFQAQARATANDPIVAIEADCIIEDAINGIVSFAWDGELVRDLLAGQNSWSGVYDLQITEAGQTLPETLWAGSLTASLDVTHD